MIYTYCLLLVLVARTRRHGIHRKRDLNTTMQSRISHHPVAISVLLTANGILLVLIMETDVSAVDNKRIFDCRRI